MKQTVTTARAILDAATLLFSEQGYDGTSVAEIAKMAGVASGTVIYQYKSKENLLQVIAWEYCNGLLQELRRAGPPEQGRTTLTKYIRNFFGFASGHMAETTVMLRYHMVFRKELHRFPLAADGFRALDVCIQELRDVLAFLLDRDGSSNDLVEQVLQGVLAQLLGSCWTHVFAGADVKLLESEVLRSVLSRVESPAVIDRPLL